jgi:hypothetical protein
MRKTCAQFVYSLRTTCVRFLTVVHNAIEHMKAWVQTSELSAVYTLLYPYQNHSFLGKLVSVVPAVIPTIHIAYKKHLLSI